MDDIRNGSRGFCPDRVVVPSGKDYSDGKEMADGKVVLPKAEAPPVVEVESRWSVFALATGQFIDVDDSGVDRPGFDIAMGGFTIGIDYRVCKNFAIGLYGEYVHSDVDFDDQFGGLSGGGLDVESGKLGIYATWFSGGLYLQGGAGGGFNSYDTHRADFFGREDGTTDGTEFSAFISTGYDWHLGCFVFGPTATLQYTTIDLNSFIEDRSSILALEFPDQSQESLRSTVGLHAAYDWRLFGLHWRSEYRAAWKHEFDDTAYGIDSRFALRALGTSLLTVRGPDVGRDSALVSSGTTILWNDRVSTYLNFDSEYGRKNYDNQSVSGGIRVRF
jgi:outer membrane autotransporter protein